MMHAIKKSYIIDTSLEEVWKALIDPKYIEGWGGGPSEMDGKVGSSFTLWGGKFFGKNTAVVHEKKLVQDWYGGKWEEPSQVVFTLQEKNGKTQLDLIHTHVPEKERKSIDSGWDEYYFGPLKTFLEEK
jgi:activator of HSP90 ATPase